MNKQISSNDKLMLSVLVCVLIIVAAYYFGYRNFQNMTVTVTAEKNALATKYSELNEIKNNVAKYNRETREYNDFFNEALSYYDSGYSQKASLIFTAKAEAELDVWVRSVAMPEAEAIYAFGKKTSTNPNRAGEKVYETDMMGYEKEMTYGYECGYDEVKQFLDYIATYDTKYMVKNFTMSYDETKKMASGTVTLVQYIITGADRPYYEPEIDSIQTGTPNLFVSETNPNSVASADDVLNMMTGYDVAISLSSKASDLSSVVVGRRGYVSSQISENSNDTVSVVITVNGSKGEYTVSYAIGEKKYPEKNYEEGVIFNPGRSLDLLVFSSERENDQDLAGANVSIINNSDKMINVKVINDDKSSPRFRIEKTEGNVRFYQ